jgi:hypothetical protein
MFYQGQSQYGYHNRYSNNYYLRAYIDYYIDPYSTLLANIESFSQHQYQTRSVNTIFIYYTDLHDFFLYFLENCIYNNPNISQIPSSYNLLTNIQSVLNSYVYMYSLKYCDKILLDNNLNRIIDGCIEVSRNRLVYKQKTIKFDKIIYDRQTYVSYNTLMKVANMCLIEKNTDFFFLKKKYLIYICIKYNIDYFVIKLILEYYFVRHKA